MTELTERLGVILLGELPSVAVDCQTSGAKPPEGDIIELGWQCCAGGEPIGEVRESMVAMTEERERMPRRIERLTGISAEMRAEAPEAAEVWRRFVEDTRQIRQASGAWPAVAHYARFEARFLLEWQRRFDPKGPAPVFLCTYEIARRLYPSLPKHSLRALAGHFGHPLPEARRAGSQVEATVFVWQRLLEALIERGIEDTKALEAFLSEKPEKPDRIGVFDALRERRGELPDAPGVYRFIDAEGGTLYVGKARSLKTRVASYFQNARRKSGHIREMIAQVSDFEVTASPTALEAALLEVAEIKRLRPPYNRTLKADDGELVFFTPDFEEQSEIPDERFTAGPFTRSSIIEVLQRLSEAAAIAQFAAVAEDGPEDAAAFEEVLHGVVSTELRVAFLLWQECFGTPPPRTPTEWIALGLAADALSDASLQLFRADRTLHRILHAAAHAAGEWKRSILFRRMGGATAVFASGAESGEMHRVRAVGAENKVPSDRATYDGLRVLVGELRRIAKSGRAVRIELAGTVCLEGESLRLVLDSL